MTSHDPPVSAPPAWRRVDTGLSGLLRALAAGLVLLGASLGFGMLLGAPPPFQVLADRILLLLPPELFDFVLTRLQFWGKPLLLLSLAGAWLAFGAALALLVGRYVNRVYRPDPLATRTDRVVAHAAIIAGAALPWLLTILVIAPVGGSGALGSETFAGPLKFTGAALLAAAVYGLALYRAYLHPALVAAMPGAGPWQASGGMARRDFVLMSGSALMGAVGGYVLTRDVSGLLANARLGGGLRGTGARPPEEITPAEDFYVVSKNFTDPEVSDVGWALKVHGLVERPLSLTLDEVKAGPSLSQIVTLECISNNIGGDLIGNGKWTGISVAGLLREAGVKPEAAYFITTAADGYHESIPVAEAMREEVMLAYALNDKPITFKHGFPLRLLYPGHYGMKSTKWIETIELSAEDRPGYWTERGWDREAVIKTRARITFPARASEFTAGPIQVYGVALAGARGVSRVEVSVDNQETWHPAELRPPLSKFAWTLWSFTWMNPEKGFQKVWARAVDGNGMVQDGNEAESFPDGATGYHSVLIKVL